MTLRKDNDQREMAASREQTQEPPQLIKGERKKVIVFYVLKFLNCMI